MKRSKKPIYRLPSRKFEYEDLEITLGVTVERSGSRADSPYDLEVRIYQAGIVSRLHFPYIGDDYNRGAHTDNDICYYVVWGFWEKSKTDPPEPSPPLPPDVAEWYKKSVQAFKEARATIARDETEWRIGEYTDGERFIKYSTEWDLTCTEYSAPLMGMIMDQFEIMIEDDRRANATNPPANS